jgi:hypothetical protein
VADAAGNPAAQTSTTYSYDKTAPVFNSASSAAIDENAGSNQAIYQATTGNDIVAYSLKPVGDYSVFTIDVDGTVSLTPNPNYELKPSYTFTVIATDLAGNQSEKEVSLAINNLDEASTGTVVISGAAAGGIQQNDVLSVNVSNLQDPDGSLISVTYSWQARTPGGSWSVIGTGSTLT